MPSRSSTAAVLLETVMVLAAAAAFAFAANELSPRGLNLTRDYFPRVSGPSHQASPLSPPAPALAASPHDEESASEETDRRIKEKGLQPMDRAQVERLFHDPRYQQGLVVFIDARAEEHYTEAHIPGAFPLDRYHPEKDLAAALTPSQGAEVDVVYCTGGECEDAEFTALLLREAGVPNEKLFIYGGGFDDWTAHHLPLEQGGRNSGLTPVQSK